MSRRLQVLLEEAEFRDVRRAARASRLTVAEWVRQALRSARDGQPLREAGRKLDAIRAGTRHSFPAPEIDQMLAEIEAGYTGRPRS